MVDTWKTWTYFKELSSWWSTQLLYPLSTGWCKENVQETMGFYVFLPSKHRGFRSFLVKKTSTFFPSFAWTKCVVTMEASSKDLTPNMVVTWRSLGRALGTFCGHGLAHVEKDSGVWSVNLDNLLGIYIYRLAKVNGVGALMFLCYVSIFLVYAGYFGWTRMQCRSMREKKSWWNRDESFDLPLALKGSCLNLIKKKLKFRIISNSVTVLVLLLHPGVAWHPSCGWCWPPFW